MEAISVSHSVMSDTLWTHGLDSSPPGSSVHGLLQARILEWVAISFFRGFSQPRDWTQVSCIAGRFFNIWATREAIEVCNSIVHYMGFLGEASDKEPACQCRRLRGPIPGSGRSPGGGNGNPLQYSCLENPMDRGAWRATVHRVPKSQTWQKQLSMQWTI